MARKPRAPKTITIPVHLDGERWSLVFEQPATLDKEEELEQWGECDHARKRMAVALGLNARDTMEGILHEAYHAADPNAPEDVTIRAAKFFTSCLWKAGFRHKHITEET